MKKISLIFAFISLLAWGTSAAPKKVFKPVDYTIASSGFQNFETRCYGNPFSGNYRSILEIAPEINGLKGVRLPVNGDGGMKSATLKLKFAKAAKVLVGVTPAKDSVSTIAQLKSLDFGAGVLAKQAALFNALSITELPAMDVYEVSYKAGEHEIKISDGLNFQVAILGVVASGQRVSARDAAIKDQQDYEAFYIEGFAEGPQLFSVVGGKDAPIIEVGSPGTEGIQGGFEGGRIVEVGGVYHMFPTERRGEPGVPAYHDRVKTTIGHWTSTDMISWTRQSTIVESTGVYAVSHEDNPMNDRRSAIWSYMPIFSKDSNRWYGHYLAYTTDKDISPNHSFGRIWRCESTVAGIEGIGGPYKDVAIVIEPGLSSQWWEGRQGVASFFPYQIEDGTWLSFISGAFPFTKYPMKSGKGWFVGLAKSDKLEGPWTRLGTDVNPTVSIHPWFVENPIVSKLPNGLYIAVFDGGPEWLKLPNQIAYTLSKDGYNWTRARYIPVDVKIKKWWTTMRTPLCLMPVGDDIYNIVFTAMVDGRRDRPKGFVQVKLDRKVLDEIAAGL